MNTWFRIAVLGVTLAFAAPAAAQYTFAKLDGQTQSLERPQLWGHVARVNLGVGFYNSGYYDCYSYWGHYCSADSYTSYIPFIVGPQIDFNLYGMNNISVGFTVLMGTVTSTYFNDIAWVDVATSVTVWEPTIDYVAKLGPPFQDTVGRLRVGGGMLIGPNSTFGGVGRIGGGASFLSSNRIGIGLDIVVEGGGMNGNWVGGVQILASPELHF